MNTNTVGSILVTALVGAALATNPTLERQPVIYPMAFQIRQTHRHSQVVKPLKTGKSRQVQMRQKTYGSDGNRDVGGEPGLPPGDGVEPNMSNGGGQPLGGSGAEMSVGGANDTPGGDRVAAGQPSGGAAVGGQPMGGAPVGETTGGGRTCRRTIGWWRTSWRSAGRRCCRRRANCRWPARRWSCSGWRTSDARWRT